MIFIYILLIWLSTMGNQQKNIFEKLYQNNKITDVTFLDVLEYKAKENNIYRPLPSWFMDIIQVDYDSFYNYILELEIINNGEDFIMLGYDEYYCIRDIANMVEGLQ